MRKILIATVALLLTLTPAMAENFNCVNDEGGAFSIIEEGNAYFVYQDGAKMEAFKRDDQGDLILFVGKESSLVFGINVEGRGALSLDHKITGAATCKWDGMRSFKIASEVEFTVPRKELLHLGALSQ